MVEQSKARWVTAYRKIATKADQMAVAARYVVPALKTPAIPVVGDSAMFPVRRIFCVGRNYAEHAIEMGSDPKKEPPFFFSKPADAIVTSGCDTPYPPATSSVHHEVELVVAIGKGGSEIKAEDAMSHVWGFAVGLDLTRRDLQADAKKHGRPWDLAKGFDFSAPIGDIVPAESVKDLTGRIELKVNGHVRQSSTLKSMIWSVPETIAHLSLFVKLQPGDLIFTGTPEGVAAVERGDVLEGSIAGVGVVTTRIVCLSFFLPSSSLISH